MPEQAVPDYSFIKRQLETGRVIPFLGAAASLVGQSDEGNQRQVPPSASQLACRLSKDTALQDEAFDLATVAQYLKAVGGAGPLYKSLHDIFSCEYHPTPLHEYLAEVATKVPLLVVTTNYDDIIEKAFQQVSHDVVVHICDPKLGDRVFWHQHRKENEVWTDSEPEKVIPNKIKKLDLSKTSVIYKMHGTVDKREPTRDQYVIAEDDYIDFLTRMSKNKAIPANFTEAFQFRHFLFLGYGLRDWNLRVILNRIQDNMGSASEFTSWAIQYQPTVLESRFWGKRDVQLFDLDLMEFVRQLKAA